ncbi:MAG: DUF86 domain-containing protein [Spirochaetota bacterium]|nr:MAG: DUF86 domain-containing protein [Spirochaetota bacterium]
MRLGVSAEENDLFDKLIKHGVIGEKMLATLKAMKGFRNFLVYEYEEVDDKLVFETLLKLLIDSERFMKAILDFVKNR